MKKMITLLKRSGFLAGILIGIIIVIFYDYLIPEKIEYPVPEDFEYSYNEGYENSGKLVKTDMRSAIIAWHYFENNQDSATGIFYSYENEPVVKMDDIPLYMLAVNSAAKLEIINDRKKKEMHGRILEFLDRLSLNNNGFFASEYGVSGDTILNSSNMNVFTAIELGAVLEPLIFINSGFSDKVYSIFRKLNLPDLLTIRKVDLNNSIDTKIYNEYISVLQLPAKYLAGSEVVNQGKEIINYEKLFRFYLLNLNSGNLDKFIDEYSNLEEGFYAKDSIMPVFGELKLGRKERLFYVTEGEEHISLESKSGAVVNDNMITVRGAFIRDLFDINKKSVKLQKQVHELFDPERGWYEGVLLTSGDVITFITAETNATVLNSICLQAYGTYY